jgi:hypothetical protein
MARAIAQIEESMTQIFWESGIDRHDVLERP